VLVIDDLAARRALDVLAVVVNVETALLRLGSEGGTKEFAHLGVAEATLYLGHLAI
jgi:hypothetical protein